MASLVDQFCPNVHDAAITAAAYDPWSGVFATADASGLVAVTRSGESSPGLLFQPGEPGVPIGGALALNRGGKLIAVGDDNGTIGVFQTSDAGMLFQDAREGARGRVRAMRGVAVSPEGARVASISADGLIRIWDVERQERLVAWQGFGGKTLEFDPRGTRILCLTAEGQPQLVDLSSNQAVPLERLRMAADRVHFSLDGTLVIASGASGISILRVVDGGSVSSFVSRGGSGLLSVVRSPDGQQLGAVSQRSVHFFTLPDLEAVSSIRHGAPEPTGAAAWLPAGVRIGGSDGLLHGGEGQSSGPVTGVGGFADHRVVSHGSRLGFWHQHRRVREIDVGSTIREAHVDREGQFIAVLPERGSLLVFETRKGTRVFDAGPETVGSPSVGIGGSVVASMLPSGGCRWWNMSQNRAFELRWPQAMTLSHGGTWLGVVTPRGAVKIIDPNSGKDALTDPQLAQDAQARLLSFVSRAPHLLVLDADNILLFLDLQHSAHNGRPAVARDVIQFGSPPDRIWGITGGQYAAVRLPEAGGCAMVFVDLARSEVVSEVAGLHPSAWIDAEQALILEPARSGALLERDMNGVERRVLRVLPGGEWLSFGSGGVYDGSANFSTALGM